MYIRLATPGPGLFITGLFIGQALQDTVGFLEGMCGQQWNISNSGYRVARDCSWVVGTFVKDDKPTNDMALNPEPNMGSCHPIIATNLLWDHN